MAYQNRIIRCFVCNARSHPARISRLQGEDSLIQREITIRPDEKGGPPLLKAENTRICFIYNCSKSDGIRALEENPACLRLNVPTKISSYFICNAVGDQQILSAENRADVFEYRNIFIPGYVKSCSQHLDDNGFVDSFLLTRIQSVNRPYALNWQHLSFFLDFNLW